MLNNKYIFAKDEQGAYHLLYALENYERDDQTYGHVREFINGVENAGYWWDVDGQDESWGHFVNWHSSMPDIDASVSQQVTAKTISFAAIIVSTVPIFLVYPFVAKYFNKGIMVGAVKG